jgi:hypothetical protein
MAERISKQILETEYKITGVEVSTQKLDGLQKAAKDAQGDTLKLVEAENKLRNASLEAGKAVATQTTKQTTLQKSVVETGKAMNNLAQTNKLKEAFTGSAQQVDMVNASLKKFEQAARGAKSVDELTGSVNELLDALPADVRDDAIKLLDKEFDKLDKTVQRPTARLRELKRLIATTDDPVLLRRYNEEAGELTDRLGDNQDLIKALASDTFFTDSLVEGAQVAVAGFTAFQGALSLVTEDQEALARASQKAQGALALLQGTQTLLNELKKQDNVLTRAQIAGQRIYAAVIGQSTGAAKGLRIALSSIGILALIGGIALLVKNWDKLSDAITGTTAAQRRNVEITKKVIESTAEESTQIEVAKARLQDANITQEDRVKLIKELQDKYPNYLKNIDAETASYDEVKKALDGVNEALLIKSGIEVRQEELVELQKQLRTLEKLGVEASVSTADAIVSFGKATAIAVVGGLSFEESFGLVDKELNVNFENQKKKVKGQIDSLIGEIVSESNKLGKLGGDPLAQNTVAATKKVEKEAAVLAGSIEFYEQKVRGITDKLTSGLVANSEEFVKEIDNLKAASKELEEAKRLLGEPTNVEVFTAGSLNALKKQASELEDIIFNLPDGSELEGQVENLRKVQAEIEALQSKIGGPKQVEEKRDINAELLDEERRYQLEVLDILNATEEEKLQLQLRYAKERLEELKKDPSDIVEIAKAENVVDGLELRLKQVQKTQKATTEQLIQASVDVLNAAANAARQFIDIKQNENAQLIDIQNQRIQDALQVADRGNAQVLEAEQERLDELNKKQADFARKQIAIATIQLAVESALAIAKAAAAGGPLAPFTIASTLIALGAGFASARAQANAISQSVPSFRKGGYTGAGDPNAESLALGSKPYTYHKNEYVMPSEVVSIGQNRKLFDDIRLKRIDLQEYMNPKAPTVVLNNDSEKVVKAIENIPGVSFNIDKNGIYTIVERKKKIENKRAFIKRK